ncbi:YceD family protein [Manganibacter manganicus]|uniref:Metal-binding protein n=1 Tax=Manganibacter manganicus TaxID=1873176 RepID=A0A1V8RWL9_9HYPH|nr:DUF177 domain-containing protein [Pseudaminobacter manganicus]OQM77553.1 metal-binding protein [Pseudaminobacter manganicus]
MQHDEAQSPVSFAAHVARLPQAGLPVVIEADEAQRAALAEAHGLLSVEVYRAELLVSRWKRNGVKVSGSVKADITQACVVTLDPVTAHIEEAVDGLFLPQDSNFGREGFSGGGEILIDAEGPDAPETFIGDTVDVGALAEQFFGLAIDPYPRRAGAHLETKADDEDKEESEFQRKLRALLPKN